MMNPMNAGHEPQPRVPGGYPQAPPPGPPQVPASGPPPPAAAQAPAYPAGQAFAPGAGLAWSPISRRYIWHRRAVAALSAVPVGAAGGLVLFRGTGTVATVLWVAAVLLAVVLAWLVAELAYRSYGYAERGDDLIVSRGVFVKRLIVVPYGRMQFVDVSAGLLERWMRIATVRMHTAAAATDAEIPGLPATEAAQLRDRLAQKGEERSMGL
jgi:membrane protein YdbS with pleckstrin-like domain